MFGKFKPRKSDTVFSLYIRGRDSYVCQSCGRSKTQGYQVQASHYFPRGVEATRFFPDNLTTLCVLCHERMGSKSKTEDKEYDLFIKNRLGEKRYKDLLLFGYRGSKKRDDVIDLLYAQKLLDELNIQWT